MASLQDFRSVGFDGQPLWTKDLREISIRLLVAAFFIGPVLFIIVETSPTAWSVFSAVCGALALVSAPRSLNRGLRKPAAILLMLSIFVALSMLWSTDPRRSLLATRDVFGYSIAALVLLQSLLVIPTDACSRIMRACIGGIAIAIAVLIARELIMAWSGGSEAAKVLQAMTLHKITFYGILFAIVLLALRTSASIAGAAVFALVTLACGRTTGVNLAIVIIAALYFVSDASRRHALTAFVALYVAFAILAPALSPILYSYLDGTSILVFHPGTFAARMEIWKSVSAHIWDAPLLGHGTNTVRNAVWLLSNPKYYVDQDLPSSHNIIIDLWFELGAVGVVLFCLCTVALARTINTLRGSVHFMCTSAFIAILIEMSVDHRIWLSWVLGTLIMAAAMCVLYSRSAQPAHLTT